MVLSELDPNSGGRDSQTSQFSGSQRDAPSFVPGNKNDIFSSGSSVLGMLKTTTETGDLGSFSSNPSRLGKLARPSPRARQGSSTIAPSRTSSHYSRNGSIHSKISDHTVSERQMPGTWPSHGPESALHLPNPKPLGPALARGGLRALALTASDYTEHEHRSASLTNNVHPPRHLASNKSVSSLNSHGRGPRPSSPHQYPHRFRRIDGRPASPALSDTAGLMHKRPNLTRPPPGSRAYSTSPVPPPRTYMVSGGNPRLGNPSSLQDIPKSFEGWQRSPMAARDQPRSQHLNAPDPYRGPQPNPMLNYQQTPRAAPQQWRAFPSPLSQNQTIDHQRAFTNGHSRAPRSTPHTGFVQRVKNILEERASKEELNARNNIEFHRRWPHEEIDHIKERAELSASPVAKRLTRDMIKAAVDTCSDADQPSSPGGFETVVSLPPNGVSFREDTGSSSLQSKPSEGQVYQADIGTGESSVSDATTQQPSFDSHSHILAITKSDPVLNMSRNDANHPQQTVDADAGLPLSALRQQHTSQVQDVYKENKSASLPPTPQQKHQNILKTRKSLPGPDELPAQLSEDFVAYNTARTARNEDSESEVVSSVDDMQSHSLGSMVSSVHTNSRPVFGIDTPDYEDLEAHENQSSAIALGSKRTTASSSNESYVRQRVSSAPAPTPASTTPRASFRSSFGSEKPEVGMIPSWNSSCTDLRLSAMKQFHFPLPDLAEDSQEDASTTNLRMLGAKPPAFRHDRKSPRRNSRPTSRAVEAPEPTKTYIATGAPNTHGIPSLEFSNVDLTTTLNHALGLRSSRSLEEVRTLMPKELDIPKLEGDRPSTSTSHRERYRSFFVRIDGEDDDGDEEVQEEEEDDEQGDCGDDGNEQHAMVLLPHSADRGSKSFDDEIITELKRLSIPSVSGLTLRLSELIPTIQKGTSALDLTKSDENVTSTLTEIRELGSPERLASMDLSRASICSSTHLPLPVRKDTIQSSHSAPESKSYADRTTLRLDKELPALPLVTPKTRASTTSAPSVLPIAKAYESKTQEICELEATVPIDMRIKPGEGTSDIRPSPQEKFKMKRPSYRTLRTLTPDGRPWNKESNYTWGAEAPSMEVKLPDPSIRENGSPTPRGRYKLRRSRSTTNLPPDNDIRIARTMSPGPNIEANLWPAAEHAEVDIVERKQGFLNTLGRKVGIKARVDKAGFPIDPLFLHPEDRLPITEPGDRYPTTGLTPPSGLSIELNRSYFSDDSSDSERRNVGTLRKRWTRLRPKKSGARTSSPGEGSGYEQGHNSSSGFLESNIDAGNPDVLILYDRTPAGMSKLEFRAKQVCEKLRVFWLKSGEVFKGRIKRNKRPAADFGETNELFPGA